MVEWQILISGKQRAYFPDSAFAVVDPAGAWCLTLPGKGPTRHGSAATVEEAKAAVMDLYLESVVARWFHGSMWSAAHRHTPAGYFVVPLSVEDQRQ